MELKRVPTREEYTRILLGEYLIRQQQLQVQQQQFLLSMAETYINDNQNLLALYLIMQKQEDIFYDEKNGTIYRYKEPQCVFQFQDKEETFPYELIKPVIEKIVDITEYILPVGTLVILKKEYFSEMAGFEEIEDIKVNIMYRYMNEGEDSYFTYGGVLYPISNLNTKSILKFTPTLIQSIEHMGYQDKEEDAFIYFIKNQLIIEEGRISAGIRIGGKHGGARIIS